MTTRTSIVAAVAALVGAAAIANADTVTGSYNGDLNEGINITTTVGPNGGQNTVRFNWTRSDSPGAGVDNTIPHNWQAYCTELTQNAHNPTTFQVQTLEDAGFTPFQALMLRRLWSTYYPSVDTGGESGAFQACVWELTYDNDGALNAGNFILNGGAGVLGIASGYMATILDAGYSGGLADLRSLTNPEHQNMLTAVPAPGSLALLGCSGLLAIRRRK